MRAFSIVAILIFAGVVACSSTDPLRDNSGISAQTSETPPDFSEAADDSTAKSEEPATKPSDETSATESTPVPPPKEEPPAPKAPEAEASTSAKVFFVVPRNGESVPDFFRVVFGLEGMTLAPAGQAKRSTGHHHLIIDGKPVPKGKVIPTNAGHIHYGKGQSQAAVRLKPGKHKLTLQFADGAHRSYGAEMSSTITINVLKKKNKK